MRTEFYKKLRGLLLAGESPALESSLEPGHLGEERLSWSGGTLGALPEGRTFCQTLSAPARLVICGGGHVARCLAPAARAVGFRVTVLENRPEVLAEGSSARTSTAAAEILWKVCKAAPLDPMPFSPL